MEASPATKSIRTSKPKLDDDHYYIPYQGETLKCDRATRVLGATKSNAGLVKWVGNLGNAAAEKFRDDAADVGKQTHALIEQDLTGKAPEMAITTPAIRRFGHFLEWKKAHKVEIVPGYRCAEHTVFSPYLLVAGTLDLHLSVNGQEWILDTKTGKSLKRDHAAQIAIYAIMEREGRIRAVQDQAGLQAFNDAYGLLQCPKMDWPRLGILHIAPDSCQHIEIDPGEAEAHGADFVRRLASFRHDRTCRPFRRLWPDLETEFLRGS